RVVLLDHEQVRAPMTAQWLRQLGHDAYVLAGGIAAAAELKGLRSTAAPPLIDLPPIALAEVAQRLRDGRLHVIDLRSSMSYRQEQVESAVWSIRPRLADAVSDPAQTVALVADEPGVAALAALDLTEAGVRDVRLLAGGHAAARAAGLAVAATPDSPGD